MSVFTIDHVVQTLNRIEQKVDANHTFVTKKLFAHMEDEENEFEKLRVTYDRNRLADEGRHEELITRLDGYEGKALAVEAAFLVHEGKPDFQGHHEDHNQRKRIGDWVGNAFSQSFLKIFEYCSLAFILWLGYTIWMTILKGPGK